MWFLDLRDGGDEVCGWGWMDAARVRRVWAEGAGGIKSSARGWGEALAGENGWLEVGEEVH